MAVKNKDDFWYYLKKYRLRKNMTVNEFADHIGVSYDTYSGIEYKRRIPEKNVFMKLFKCVSEEIRTEKMEEIKEKIGQFLF